MIYCSITSFGQDGPYANRAGYDYIIQGTSTAARRARLDLDGVPSVRLPITFSDAETTAATASPKSGQHQDLLD